MKRNRRIGEIETGSDGSTAANKTKFLPKRGTASTVAPQKSTTTTPQANEDVEVGKVPHSPLTVTGDTRNEPKLIVGASIRPNRKNVAPKTVKDSTTGARADKSLANHLAKTTGKSNEPVTAGNDDRSQEEYVNDSSADETCTHSGEGSSDEEEEEPGEATQAVTQPPNVVWNLDCTFEQKEQLDEFFKTEYWWSCRGTTATTKGTKVLYRCNRVARQSKVQCAAGLYVLTSIIYEKDGRSDISSLHSVYRKNTLHTHDTNAQMVGKVSWDVKQLIIEQFKNGRKAKATTKALLID